MMTEGMTPEEKAMVMAIAGPLVQEAKYVESMMDGTMRVEGMPIGRAGDDIARSLDRDFRSNHSPQPQSYFQPPEMPQFVQNAPQYYQAEPAYPQAQDFSSPRVDDGQLEFQFNQSEQIKTNDLLEKILKKLTILLTVIESTQSADKKSAVIKLKP